MKVQQVYPRLLEPVDLVYSGTTKTEKNWSPLRFDTKANEMLFSRFIEPHQVPKQPNQMHLARSLPA